MNLAGLALINNINKRNSLIFEDNQRPTMIHPKDCMCETCREKKYPKFNQALGGLNGVRTQNYGTFSKFGRKKSVRKPKKSVKISVRKSVRKSARKSARKSSRKSDRKSARKSTRKSTRK